MSERTVRSLGELSVDYVRRGGLVVARVAQLPSGWWLAAPITVDGREPWHACIDRWASVAWVSLEIQGIGPLTAQDDLTVRLLGDLVTRKANAR